MKSSIFLYILSYFFFITGSRAEYEQSSNYFCTDLKTQTIVDIAQLEGIWYVIEKIIHTEDSHYIVNKTTCPVIFISEDHRETSTYNPSSALYRSSSTSLSNRHDRTNYDSDYSSYDNRNPIDTRTADERDYYRKQQEQYDPSTAYPHQRRKNFHSRLSLNHLFAMKYLRIYWDDNSESIEYHLKYNVSRPGFWISSGPENSDELPRDIKPFAGTVQVLKAVGNHMALIFCHQLLKRQLFTVILSREMELDSRDRHSVHGLLIRKGLNINAVEKTCNSAKLVNFDVRIILLILGIYVFKF